MFTYCLGVEIEIDKMISKKLIKISGGYGDEGVDQVYSSSFGRYSG
jgi:hypothetical protein